MESYRLDLQSSEATGFRSLEGGSKESHVQPTMYLLMEDRAGLVFRDFWDFPFQINSCLHVPLSKWDGYVVAERGDVPRYRAIGLSMPNK